MERVRDIWGYIVTSFQVVYYIARYGLEDAGDLIDKELKAVKKELKEKFIDITPGVCGNDSHQHILEMPESGMMIVGETTYHWYGGCPRCVAEKLEELKNVAKDQKR